MPLPQPVHDRQPEFGRSAARLLVVVLLVVLAACTRRSASEFAASPTTSTSAATTTPDSGESTSTSTSESSGERQLIEPSGDAEFDEVVTRLARYVEQERGLDFKNPVRVQLLEDGAFEQRLLDDFDSEQDDETVTYGRVLQALGLIDPGTDIVGVLRQVIGEGVLGFYDPKDDELVVRGAGLSPYTQQTVVHELVHALDDQHFDLDREQYDEADGEIGFGFTVLAEGNASHIEDEWTSTLSPEESRELRREQSAFGADVYSDVPRVVLVAVTAPYELGPTFVESVLDAGGQQAIDDAFAEPPVSSEQVMHPELYLSDVQPRPVAPPPAEGPVIDDGTFGEFSLVLLLAETIGARAANAAADGWGGDSYVAWDTGGGTVCVRVDVVMDDETETRQLVDALQRWASGQPGAVVESTVDGATRLTSCG